MTQTKGVVTLPEKAPLTLKCTYQSSYPVVLFWYVQYQNKELELLLRSSLGNQVTSRGFEATHTSNDSSFHLQKSSVQTSDSAVYYCALRDTVREAAGGAERKPKGTDGIRLWAALQSSMPEASSKHFQLGSSELRTLEFLDCPMERNLGRDSVKRNLSTFLQKCLFSAHSHSPKRHRIP